MFGRLTSFCDSYTLIADRILGYSSSVLCPWNDGGYSARSLHERFKAATVPVRPGLAAQKASAKRRGTSPGIALHGI